MTVSLAWEIATGIWVGSEILIAVATRTRRGAGGEGAGRSHDRGTMLLLWVVIFGSVTAGTWVGEASGLGRIPNAGWMRPAGLGMLIAGMLLRWVAVVSLGKSFSSNVAIRAGQRVYRQGLYRWMRHPSYTGLLLSLVAVGVHARNWIALVVVVVPTTAAVLYRIHVEEIALRGAFGAEYVEYSRETRRLIPGVY